MTEANFLEDFKNQDRIILGSNNASDVVSKLYKDSFQGVEIIECEFEEAEMVKYFTNSFLATKVAFANEFYQLCKEMNINYDNVSKISMIDNRLGKSHFSVPGPDGKLGFGGSCFPKDINGIINIFKKYNINPYVLNSVWERNITEDRPAQECFKFLEELLMNKIINNNSINLSAFYKNILIESNLIKKIFSTGLIIILLIYFFSDRLYTSKAAIAPINDFEQNAVSSVLASQLGLSNNVNIDPKTIFESEGLKKTIIYRDRELSSNLEKINLIEFWEIGKPRWYNPIDWMGVLIGLLKSKNEGNSIIKIRSLETSAIKKLNTRISYSQDFYTNEIIITTTMEDRALAQEINNDIINYINTFITNSKNKNAASQAFVLNKRLNEVKQSLQESEDEMEKFLEDNISFQDLPSLQKIYMRIARKIEIDTQIIIQLTTQMEVNKVNELSEVSNFVIVDDSSFPAKKVYPKASNLLFYLIFSVIMIILAKVLYEDIKRKENN